MPVNISNSSILDVGLIYHEPAVLEHPRGREILERFPDAERRIVRSHWNIPGLHGNEGAVAEWVQIKRTVLVLGVKKSITTVENGRSADFIAPGHANGCVMACVYCYVPRRKGFANPITTYVNIEDICRGIRRHVGKLGPKTVPNQVDPRYWVYDIGCNSDCSVDALISENVRDLYDLFGELPDAKGSFATKFVNRDLLDYETHGKMRIRFSLMPPSIAKVVDVRTSSIPERIEAINDFVEAGYEVHLNLSPVIYYPDWLRDYAELFQMVNDGTSEKAKRQLQAEIIFLTHNEGLHEVNLQWHPKAEELLWQPAMQEKKISEGGGLNVRYKRGTKGKLVQAFCDLLAREMPYCPVRYAF
ncbi:MAG: Radical domain protein [Verrucomicrobiales bacterium]|nr:Radical domain protein [Verrucomicrobiales bacterium]